MIRFLRRGGFGKVWLRRSEAMENYRSLKWIPATQSDRLEKEYEPLLYYRKVAARLRSPHLVTIEHVRASRRSPCWPSRGEDVSIPREHGLNSPHRFVQTAAMPPPPQPRTPGYRFKDGRLMIFQEDEVMLIRGWEEPTAVCKSDEAWEPFSPEFRLVAPYRRAAKPAAKKVANPPSPASGQMEFGLWDADAPVPTPKPSAPKPMPLAEQRRKAFDSFRFSLPKEIAKVLEPFRSHQWPLLILLAHDKRVLDLASSNPVLAYAVANWYADYPRSRLDFGRMPQRDLLKLLKLPDSAAVVKLIRKIPPESVDQRLWPTLIAALRHPDGASSKFLSHVPTINVGVMELILSPQTRGALTPGLLEEVAADPKEKYRGTVARMIGGKRSPKRHLMPLALRSKAVIGLRL